MKHRGDFSVCRTLFGRNFGLSRTVTVTSAATLTLNAYSTGYQIFDGSAVGQVLNLGDATTYFDNGQSWFILNDSSESIIIENSGGTDLFTLQPKFGVIAVLEDDSTADGLWRFFLFLDNTLDFISNSASPGFTYGSSGKSNSGKWLLNDTVPSNLAGRFVFLNNTKIVKLFTTNQNLSTYNISIYSHEGDEVNLTLLTTQSVVSSRGESFDLNIPIPSGKQLAVRITSGSGKNVTAGLSLTGTVI